MQITGRKLQGFCFGRESTDMENNITHFDKCAGCGACINSCLADAIYVDGNSLFYEIKVDDYKCVNCGRCVSVCPVNRIYKKESLNEIFDVSCFNGGFAGWLAGHVLDGGGLVFGAVFSDETGELVFSGTDEVPLGEIMPVAVFSEGKREEVTAGFSKESREEGCVLNGTAGFSKESQEEGCASKDTAGFSEGKQEQGCALDGTAGFSSENPLKAGPYIKEIIKRNHMEVNPGFTYRRIKRHIGREKQVLFIGKPCQAAGLKRYLVYDYDNILTIDFPCGGTVSHKTDGLPGGADPHKTDGLPGGGAVSHKTGGLPDGGTVSHKIDVLSGGAVSHKIDVLSGGEDPHKPAGIKDDAVPESDAAEIAAGAEIQSACACGNDRILEKAPYARPYCVECAFKTSHYADLTLSGGGTVIANTEKGARFMSAYGFWRKSL